MLRRALPCLAMPYPAEPRLVLLLNNKPIDLKTAHADGAAVANANQPTGINQYRVHHFSGYYRFVKQ